MNHRIRYALQNGGFELSGKVEVDETFIGGKARFLYKRADGKRITKVKTKSIVFGLLERTSKDRHSRVILHKIPNVKKPAVQRHVRKYVLKGSTVYSDAYRSYRGLSDDYVHEVIDHAEAYAQGQVHINGLENFWSLLKRSIKGTYVSVEPFHLFRYLDEQAYRFNERKGSDFDRFDKASSSIAGKRLPFLNLIGKSTPNAEAEAQPF